MGIRINTNILSLNAQTFLTRTSKALNRALEQLSSGQRINRAGDDASGLSIANGLDSQVRGYTQAARNMNDAMGFLNTAEGALATQTSLVQRMRELAVQAANGTLSTSDRKSLDGELQQLLAEFQRVATSTNFNGVKLLDGSFATTSLQVGTKSNENISFSLASTQASGVFNATVTTVIPGVNGKFSADPFLPQQVEVQQITTLDATAVINALDSNGQTGVFISTPKNNYQVWFTVDGVGGPTSYSKFGTIAVEVDLNSTDTDVQVATAMANALKNISDLSITQNGSALTLTNKDIGSVPLSSEDINYPIGFTHTELQKGLNSELTVGGSPVTNAVLADINGDGKSDIIQTNYSTGNISVFLGNGNGSFSVGRTLSVGIYSVASPILRDINGDGKIDLIQDNAYDVSTSIFLGNGNGTFLQLQSLNVGGAFAVATDINGDGKIDVVESTNGSTKISIFLGNGNGSFAQGKTLSLGYYGSSTPLMVDVNGDGKIDLITNQRISGELDIFLGNGNGTFVAPNTLALPGLASASPSAVDLNGDGKLDLIQNAGDVAIFLGNGNGSFVSRPNLSGGNGVGKAVAVDLNGDGKLDIVQNFTSGYGQNGGAAIFLGNGNGTFSGAQTFEIGLNPQEGPLVADVNNDGKLDVLVTNGDSNNISVLLGNGNGSFHVGQTISVGSSPVGSPQRIDLNGDGVPDLIETNRDSGTISIFLAQTSTTDIQTLSLSDASIATQSSANNMISLADAALATLNSDRASIGALQSRLQFSQNFALVARDNLAQAKSQIMDTDYASSTADLVRNQILQQAGVSALAQSNNNLQVVLQLLKF